MRIAAVQMASKLGDAQTNVRRALEFADAAADRGACLVVYPEYFNLGAFTMHPQPETLKLAEPLDGFTVTSMREGARRLGAWMLVPFFELEDGQTFNSSVVLDPDGEVRARYRKRFVPAGRMNEKYFFAPGNLPSPVWEIDRLKFGVSICFERNFFETARLPALLGAHVLCHVTATFSDGSGPGGWFSVLTATARTTSLWVLCANGTCPPGEEGPSGGSHVVSPSGDVVAALGTEEDILIADLDDDAVVRSRTTDRFIKEQRLDLLREMAAVSV